MKDAQPLRAPICFGVFELDPKSGELRKHGLKVRLQDQPFQILQILLEHPGKVVTREELQQRIWPADTFVDFDQGLYNATKKLREALGDSADTPRYVETLSRRGYRFIGAVNGSGIATLPSTEGAPKSATAETRASRRKLQFGIAIGLGAAALIGGVLSLMPAKVWQRLAGKNTVPQIRSVAVLPLQNLSADPAQEYFSEGMTDALITDLAQIGSLKVISRTSITHYKQTDKSLPEIARELNVDGIVEGTVQRSGDRVRITAQLIYGPSDKHLWANSYERDLRDALPLERDLAEEIADQIQARLTTKDRAQLAQLREVNPNVLDAYLEGNYHLSRWGRGSGDEEKRKAAEYFQQVIDADPNFVLGYIGLADSHAELMRGSREHAAIRRKAVERAVTLDPDSSEAHAELGDLKIENWDWQGAEKEYRQAVALNANNSAGHNGLCYLLIQLGRLDDGLRECQVSQVLDPNEDHLTSALYSRREYDRTIEVLLRMLKSHPDRGDLHYTLYASYAEKRMYKEATQELEIAARLFGFPEIATNLHRAYANSGYSGAMREWAKAMENLVVTKQAFLSIELAETYAALGKNDRAFYWLEQAYKNHDIGSAYDVDLRVLKVEPMLDPLRSDARFKDLLRRTGLI